MVRERKGIARRHFLQLLGLGLGIGLVETGVVEPRWVEVTRHTVYLPDLPLGLDGLVLAHLTDIHYGSITPKSTIRRAVRLAANAKPDLVLLTGDFVRWDTTEAERLAPLLAPLRSARLGIYGCLGNHDYGDMRSAPAMWLPIFSRERPMSPSCATKIRRRLPVFL